MRRLFAVLVVLAVGVAAVGFYRGWFDVGWEKKADGTGQITGTVNPEKIREDRNRATEKVHDLARPSGAAATEKPKSGE